MTRSNTYYSRRTRRPYVRALAMVGAVALLAQSFTVMPAACAPVHEHGPADSSESIHHGPAQSSMQMTALDPSDGPDESHEQSRSDCSVMDHCASWITARNSAPAALNNVADVPRYGAAWQLHMAFSGHLTPPPKT